tara:strand:- start:1020 stop:1184 length:165 start_codon:yes stop_codon:yes gene_type:complete
MKEIHNIIGLEDLKINELKAINGGFWIEFAIGYVISEVINGIQDGLSAECPPNY